MEVLGTLLGAAIQGQIVASAHTLKHCPTHNVSAGYLGNSSGAEVVESVVRVQAYLSQAVSVWAPGWQLRCAWKEGRFKKKKEKLSFSVNLTYKKGKTERIKEQLLK